METHNLFWWWRHDMGMLSALLALGDGVVTSGFPYEWSVYGAVMFSLLLVWTSFGPKSDMQVIYTHMTPQ